MARELHDGIVQSLIGLKLQVTILRNRCADDDPAAASLEQFASILDREVVDLRSLMFQMTPIDHLPADLGAVLGDLVDRFGRAANISARLVSNINAAYVPVHTRHEIARIVQEALVNVRKHSGARHVLVSVSADGTGCTLVIDDDGRGFDFEGSMSGEELDRQRKGPRTIKERVRLLGGSMAVDSKPDAGSRIEISVPLG